jgi:hypothetical protein
MAAIASVVGNVVGGALEMEGYNRAADASRLAGQRRNVASQFEAEQLEQNAGQVVAASQRDALEERRRADLMASRALALAAASGGGSSDPTVVNIIAKLKGEGSYRSAVALYRGETEARRLRMGAKAKRYEGAVAEEGGEYQAAGYETMAVASLFKTVGSSIGPTKSLFERYNGSDGPTSGGYR